MGPMPKKLTKKYTNGMCNQKKNISNKRTKKMWMKLLLNNVKINLSTKLPKQQILKVIEKKIEKITKIQNKMLK